MRRFILKFIIVSLIVLIPAGYFRFYVIKSVSGDIGKLGIIPYGAEYEGLDVSWYERDSSLYGEVLDVYERDSLKYFQVITIGDSFSQFNKMGYQYALSVKLKYPIANFKSPDYLDVANSYMALINGGYLRAGQVVIVESVERSLIGRFSNVDTLKKFKPPHLVLSDKRENNRVVPFLNRYFSWIRLKCNYKCPITKYKLSKDCFTHSRFSRTLHVYNSVQDDDGDLLWQNLSEDVFARAIRNMENIIDISTRKGINLIILIATDKYDAYEPWISTTHQKNTTLNKIPHNRCIFDSRPVLRNAIESGIKDVYKLNNTHWSIIGADIIGASLYKSIKTAGFCDLN